MGVHSVVAQFGYNIEKLKRRRYANWIWRYSVSFYKPNILLKARGQSGETMGLQMLSLTRLKSVGRLQILGHSIGEKCCHESLPVTIAVPWLVLKTFYLNCTHAGHLSYHWQDNAMIGPNCHSWPASGVSQAGSKSWAKLWPNSTHASSVIISGLVRQNYPSQEGPLGSNVVLECQTKSWVDTRF